MSVTPYALTTLSNLKAALRVSSSSDDPFLEQLIDRATYWVESRTNRRTPDGKYGLKARRYNNGGSTHTTTLGPDEDYIYFDGTTKDQGGHTITNRDTGLGE